MLTIRKGSNATKGNVEMSTLFPDCHRSPHSNGHLNQCHRRSSPVLVTVYKQIVRYSGAKELRSVLSSLSICLRQEEMEPSTASEGLDQSSDRMKSSSVGHPPERLDPGRQEQLR